MSNVKLLTRKTDGPTYRHKHTTWIHRYVCYLNGWLQQRCCKMYLLVFMINHDVVRLDISMHDAHTVAVVQSLNTQTILVGYAVDKAGIEVTCNKFTVFVALRTNRWANDVFKQYWWAEVFEDRKWCWNWQANTHPSNFPTNLSLFLIHKYFHYTGGNILDSV